MKICENLPENVKGIILIVAGFALLLNTLGILASISWYILIAMSLCFIFVGFVKIKAFELVKSMLEKAKKDTFNSEKRD